MLPRWLINFRALALACAFAAAFVPIATYITDDKRDWLWIHIGVNIAAYIAVALTTICTTVHLTQQDHNKFSVPAYWANNVVMRTWYLGVSKTWRWHVAAAVGRLGLALAMMEHLASMYLYGPQYSIFSPYIYYKEMGERYSQWETLIIAFVALVGFAIAETGLLAAFTTFFATLRRSLVLTSVFTLAIRIAIIILFIQTMKLANPPGAAGPEPASYVNYDKAVYKQHFGEWYHVAFTWLDNGTMMSAKVLRPLKNYECTDWYTHDNYSCHEWSSRPHIVVAGFQIFAAYATYILAIGALLQLAHYLHWREQNTPTIPTSTN